MTEGNVRVMDGKALNIRKSPLKLSLANLSSLLRTKIVTLGGPTFYKAYEHFDRPRNGVTIDAMKKGLVKFGITVSSQSIAALVRSICSGHFPEEDINRALARGSRKGLDFRKFITLWLKDENINLQDVLENASKKIQSIVRNGRRKPWEPKDKNIGARQLTHAHSALEQHRVANLKARDIEAGIWKFITLRCRNNSQERELLYRILNKPRPALSAEEFQSCVQTKMRITMGPKILNEIVSRYGYNDGSRRIDFDKFIATLRENASKESKAEYFGNQGGFKVGVPRGSSSVGTEQVERLMHKKILERANPKVGQFKQTFMMFAPERFEGNTGPSTWMKHFEAVQAYDDRAQNASNGAAAPINTGRGSPSSAYTTRRMARQYAVQHKQYSEAGITPALLRKRLHQIGINATEEQAKALFSKYDVDNNGQLSFYEFACRAVPPDYKGKGSLYSLTGGGGDGEGQRSVQNGFRPSSEENIKVNKDDIDLFCKERDFLDTAAVEIPTKYFRPRSTARSARSRNMLTGRSSYQQHVRSQPELFSRPATQQSAMGTVRSYASSRLSTHREQQRKMLRDFKKTKYLKKIEEGRRRGVRVEERLDWSDWKLQHRSSRARR